MTQPLQYSLFPTFPDSAKLAQDQRTDGQSRGASDEVRITMMALEFADPAVMTTSRERRSQKFTR